jgi:glycerol-3-phosphate dehydrogenase (NAD(P)+)
MPPRPQLSLPTPGSRRAVVVGAGSFGTAVAVLLARGGLRVTLQTRTAEQAERLAADGENMVYLPEVQLPRELRIEPASAGLARADYVFLGVPSRGLAEVIAGLEAAGLPRRTPVISLAKGLVPPNGAEPSVLLGDLLGADRVAVIGGPAHAREMVTKGAALVAAAVDERLAHMIANVFTRAGVVCERSSDPIGVELAGAAKNAAALAAGATESQGLNAAGAAAGHIFSEVWRYAALQGARPESMIGLAGTGDLVGTALAPQSRNRRAGELLAQGVSAEEIPGQDRTGGGVARPRPVAGLRARRGWRRSARHARSGTPDRRRAAARRLGRPGSRHRPAAGPLHGAELVAAAAGTAPPARSPVVARRRSRRPKRPIRPMRPQA